MIIFLILRTKINYHKRRSLCTKDLLFSSLVLFISCLFIAPTMAQIARVKVPTDVKLVNMAAFQISRTPAKQNTTIDFLHVIRSNKSNFSILILLFMVEFWMVNQTVFNNDAQILKPNSEPHIEQLYNSLMLTGNQ